MEIRLSGYSDVKKLTALGTALARRMRNIVDADGDQDAASVKALLAQEMARLRKNWKNTIMTCDPTSQAGGWKSEFASPGSSVSLTERYQCL